jgi:DNA repair ATPase RecN
MGFLPSLAFYVLLFILFILIFIYVYRLTKSSDLEKLKKLVYHIHTPQDITNLQNYLRNIVANFSQDVSQMKGDFTNLINTLRNKYLSQQHPPTNIKDLINLLRKIRDNINDFISEYENYKKDLDWIEASINRHYNEPLRSHLLKILEEEGKKKITDIAKLTYHEYLQEYQTLRNNRHQIKNLAISHRYKRTIDNIFNEMENLIHSFRI